MFNPTDVIVIFGQRGSGKSTMQKTVTSLYSKIVVIDRLKEHNDGEIITCPIRFGERLKVLGDSGETKFKIIFQFEIGMNPDLQDEIFSEVVRLSYLWGRIYKQNLCLSIEEVHFYASAVSINDWLFEAILTGRHSNLAIICSSQRPASVHKSIVSQASHVLVGRLFEKRDIEYLLASIGQEALKAGELQKYKFLHFQTGVKEVKEIPNSVT